MPQILVIEDDTDFNEILCKVLTKKGHDVLSATNGKTGIDLYREHSPDLVITDVLMPEQDGIEVIVSLRKIYPNVKVIAISGGGDFGSGSEYLQSTQTVCDIQYTLTKPFEKDKLLEMIQKILN